MLKYWVLEKETQKPYNFLCTGRLIVREASHRLQPQQQPQLLQRECSNKPCASKLAHLFNLTAYKTARSNALRVGKFA